MKVIKGDLIKLAKEGKFDVIVHGCNCFHTMGAGIARGIKEEFPEAYVADCDTSKGEKRKLGSFSCAHIERDGMDFTVVNAYTQFDHRGDGPNVDYDAIAACMRAIRDHFPGVSIGLPQIGAGLADGDWERISKIIEEVLGDEDVTIVEFAPDEPECEMGRWKEELTQQITELKNSEKRPYPDLELISLIRRKSVAFGFDSLTRDEAIDYINHTGEAMDCVEKGIDPITGKSQKGKTIALDFDGVIHRYTSGWKGANVIPDRMVPGAAQFLRQAIIVEGYRISIFSARLESDETEQAMKQWMVDNLQLEFADGMKDGKLTIPRTANEDIAKMVKRISYSRTKPHAEIYIDDRGYQFHGTFPSFEYIKNFKPWNKGQWSKENK